MQSRDAMTHINASKRKNMFTPLLESASVQAATMVLKRGQSSSDKPEDEQ